MNQSRVTFIIPTLDRPTLKRSIESLNRQTNPNWNCLIVYDGVQPSTSYECDKIRNIYTEKLGNENERGHNSSGMVRNIALKDVSTEWIAFLDDDDTITSDYVELLLSKYVNFDLVIFRMLCNKTNTTIPKQNDNDIRFGNVGISFAFKAPEQPILFTKNRDGEDFDFVKKLIGMNYSHVVTDETCYHIKA